MTIQEIIKNLLNQAEDRETSAGPEDPEDIFQQDARTLREAVRLLSQTELLNEPLTLDQLLEMDGEPVWCVSENGESRWGIVHVYGECDFECYTTEYGRIDGWSYGMKDEVGWLAYRRKPGEMEC